MADRVSGRSGRTDTNRAPREGTERGRQGRAEPGRLCRCALDVGTGAEAGPRSGRQTRNRCCAQHAGHSRRRAGRICLGARNARREPRDPAGIGRHRRDCHDAEQPRRRCFPASRVCAGSAILRGSRQPGPRSGRQACHGDGNCEPRRDRQTSGRLRHGAVLHTARPDHCAGLRRHAGHSRRTHQSR